MARFVCVVFVVAVACGGASESARNESFSRIQRSEQALSLAMHEGHCANARTAADALCDEARNAGDSDARVRCDRAQEQAARCGGESQ